MTASLADPIAPRVAIVTLGCGRNEVDSDQLAGLLHREGMDVVRDATTADVVMVNTCTFIEPAKQESIDTVLAACDLKDEGARAVLVVGCMAERYPQELADAIPEADAIVGFAGYPELPGLVGDILAGRSHDRVVVEGPEPAPGTADAGAATDGDTDAAGGRRRSLPLLVAPMEPPPEAAPVERATTPQDALDRMPSTGPRFPVRSFDGDQPWAYLKIASGCDRKCTFCAIPSFRGRFRSRPLDEIVAEAGWLADQGARELVLVSENTTSWGKDLPGGRDAQPKLLRELAGVEGVERIRLMYLQPAELQRPLVEAMTAIPEVASYFDLSLQHAAAGVLERMARSGSPERFLTLIERIRELDPDAVFRSNFILGFPGETEDDVATLEEFLTAARLDWVGLFTFSREDGTPSADMDGQVPADEAAARRDHLSIIQEHLADEAAARFVDRELAVTVQETAQGVTGSRRRHPGLQITAGRSYREAPETDGEVRLVTADGAPADLPVGRTVTARVRRTEGVDLVAEVVGG